jgi:hypothetical protein
MDIGGGTIDEAARQAGLEFLWLFALVVHDRNSIAIGPGEAGFVCGFLEDRGRSGKGGSW